MPTYRMICNLPELHHNGKKYHNGDTIIERVVVTAEEAKIMNERQTETILELTSGEKKELPFKFYQASKDQLIEQGKKMDLVLDPTMTRSEMIQLIKQNQEKEE